jgi:hypothetical protein
MKELSNGMTLYYRTFIPFLFASVSIVGLVVSHGQIGLALPGIVLFGYTFWFGRRLSDVWLDGDVLEIKGPTASFRVPLSDVRLLETRWGRARLFVLGLDHPVGKIEEVRFIPKGDWVAFGPNPAVALEKDLQARIHAARSARKA